MNSENDHYCTKLTQHGNSSQHTQWNKKKKKAIDFELVCTLQSPPQIKENHVYKNPTKSEHRTQNKTQT